MLRDPVAVPIIRGTLEAIALAHPRWKTPEAVWEAFRAWSARRGATVGRSWSQSPLFFQELQGLYDFGIESCPATPADELLRESGRRFAAILVDERLPDLVSTCLAPSPDLPGSLERLFLRFMDQYGRGLYRVEPGREEGGVRFRVTYSDPEAIGRTLAAVGRDLVRAFRPNFMAIVGAVEVCVGRLLEGWDAGMLSVDPDRGTFLIRVPGGAAYNYGGLVGTLTRFAHALQDRHARELQVRDLERDLLLSSPLLRETWDKVRTASATDETMLLRGEPGTGKTHLAERIHALSPRRGRPFVEVCLTADVGSDDLVQSHLFGHVKGAFTGALEDKEGLFEHARGGTIFLDEIGDAGPELQARLLRVIEKKTFKPLGSTRDVTVDVRIVAATNRNLEERVREEKFREDLYHRLDVIQVELPPLRARAAEIPLLAEHFLRRASADLARPAKPLEPDAVRLLSAHPWPGNFRELINALKHALLFSRGERIAPGDFPNAVRRAVALPPAPSGAVIDVARLRRLLEEGDSAPVPESARADCPWHVEHAKKTYLEALIRHHRGNVHRIASSWDRSSERAVRVLIKRYGLWNDLERARLAT